MPPSPSGRMRKYPKFKCHVSHKNLTKMAISNKLIISGNSRRSHSVVLEILWASFCLCRAAVSKDIQSTPSEQQNSYTNSFCLAG